MEAGPCAARLALVVSGLFRHGAGATTLQCEKCGKDERDVSWLSLEPIFDGQAVLTQPLEAAGPFVAPEGPRWDLRVVRLPTAEPDGTPTMRPSPRKHTFPSGSTSRGSVAPVLGGARTGSEILAETRFPDENTGRGGTLTSEYFFLQALPW